MQQRHQRKLAIQSQKNNPDAAQTPVLFLDHLHELRNRFFFWLASFILATVAGFVLYEPILEWLARPLNSPLYYTSPVGGFEAILEVAIFLGIVISLPVMIYQIVRFLEPALGNLPHRMLFTITVASLCLALLGILTAYYLVIPGALNFLSEFGSELLQPIISTNEYFSFITKYLFGFALLFQLPLIMLLINLFKQLKPLDLFKKFPYVIALSFLIAAILTPTPDFVNQTIMALPIILLYILSILLVWSDNKLKSRKASA